MLDSKSLQVGIGEIELDRFRQADFWGVEIGWVNPLAFMEGNRREHVGLIRVWEI